MKKTHDLCVKVGEKSDGKAVWKSVGALMEGDKGPFILLDKTFNPAGVAEPGKSSIIVSAFEPKPKDDNGGAPW